jgi:hypothetical protein
MCRTATVDIAGRGPPDIVIAESEYMDGHFSWFENHPFRIASVGRARIDRLVYAHSLEAGTRKTRPHLHRRDNDGGWDAPRFRMLAWLSSARSVAARPGSDLISRAGHPSGQMRCGWRRAPEWLGVAILRSMFGTVPTAPPCPFASHRLLGRDKPTPYRHLAADVDGDGKGRLCGSWWYRNGSWERHGIPGIHQAISAYDIDGDGRKEVIATKQRAGASSGYDGLTSELVWLKPIDPLQGKWRTCR